MLKFALEVGLQDVMVESDNAIVFKVLSKKEVGLVNRGVVVLDFIFLV